MAKADVSIVETGGATTRSYDVESGAVASIKAGEPVKVGGTGNNYVVLLATGDPEVGTDRMVGIAKSNSTDTATADGKVEVLEVVPGKTIMRCKATTVANINTVAERIDILNDTVTFDLTGTTFTIDENEGDDPNVHGLMIKDVDIVNGTIDFQLVEAAGMGGQIA